MKGWHWVTDPDQNWAHCTHVRFLNATTTVPGARFSRRGMSSRKNLGAMMRMTGMTIDKGEVGRLRACVCHITLYWERIGMALYGGGSVQKLCTHKTLIRTYIWHTSPKVLKSDDIWVAAAPQRFSDMPTWPRLVTSPSTMRQTVDRRVRGESWQGVPKIISYP